MHKRITSSTGFTIVELLIVVVVIAILAAISIVAYTNIQNRAYDSAVQHDLNSFAKKIELAAAETGRYPAAGATRQGGVSTGSTSSFPGFTFRPSKNAYLTSGFNLYYCTGTDSATGQEIFRIAAISRSGNTFENSSNSGIQNKGPSNISSTTICQGLDDPHSYSIGYSPNTGSWSSWTDG